MMKMENSLYILIFLVISIVQGSITSSIKFAPTANQKNRILLDEDQSLTDKQSEETNNVVIQDIPESLKVSNNSKIKCKVWKSHAQKNSFFQFMTKKCLYNTNGTHLKEMQMNVLSQEKPKKLSRYHFKVQKFQTKPLHNNQTYSVERSLNMRKYNKTRKEDRFSDDILKDVFRSKEKKMPNFGDLFRFANSEMASLEHLIPLFGKWFPHIHFPFKKSIISKQESLSDRNKIHPRYNLISRRIHARKRIPNYKLISEKVHSGKILPRKIFSQGVHSGKIFPKFKLISQRVHSGKIIPKFKLISKRVNSGKIPHKNSFSKRVVFRKIPHKITMLKKGNSVKNNTLISPRIHSRNNLQKQPLSKRVDSKTFPPKNPMSKTENSGKLRPKKMIPQRLHSGKRFSMPVKLVSKLTPRKKMPSTSKTSNKYNEGKSTDTWPTNSLFTKSAKFNHNYIPSPGDLDEKMNPVSKPYHRIPRSLKKLRGKNNDRAWMDQNSYRALFKKYYKCLDKKVADIKGELDNAIKPVLLMVGQSVELRCDVCMRPDQNAAALGIDWQMMRRSDGMMKHVTFKKNSRMRMTKDYTLHIMNTNMKDAGQYFCVMQNNYASVYQVDILLNEKRRVMHEDSEDDRPEPTLVLDERNLKISTVWTDWSFCDRCGQMGTQRKLGLCMVTKLDKRYPIEPEDFPMIDLYPDGIPCHSTALPTFLKNIPVIRDRPSETLIRDCMQECPTTPGPINITDKAGKLIEVLEPGFYSIHNPPTLPPITIRKVIYEDAGKHLVLSCPKQLTKVITIWKRGRVVIDPLSIRSLTRNRVFLDNANRLHIRKLFLTDTSSYLCFLKQEHVATFKVIVYEPLNQQLKDHISLIGMVLTCVSSIVICLCLCAKKNKKTQK